MQNLTPILIAAGALLLLRKSTGINGLNDIDQQVKEAKILQPWIKSWRISNEHKNWSIEENNRNFRKEFENFMKSKGFTNQRIKAWLK